MEELKKLTLRGEELGHLAYENKDDYIELVQIFVKEDQRKKGIGEELLNELISIARKRNVSKICVVSTTNETQDFGRWLIEKGFKNISVDAPQWCLEVSTTENLQNPVMRVIEGGLEHSLDIAGDNPIKVIKVEKKTRKRRKKS